MDEHTALLADASLLVQRDLFRHLEEAEYLSEVDWTEKQDDLVRDLLVELPMVIRHTIGPHHANEDGDCLVCQRAWPCQVVTTVHRLVKNPEHHFLRLIRLAEDA